ncbi:hypothetical protein F7725_023803 [Dissostichus mawsoni]|uniref:Secreted protein n=1 Tax=Dissostichus mawsoni TaxID=36200 RepID=A0A7J5XXM6_DISMA|nr:hypothetical protein F7725_023803 [Dissostichus mawsoni]
MLLTLLLLELHVTMVKHSTGHLVNAHLLFISEAQDINSILILFKYVELKITHIRGFQLHFVINAGHNDLTHATHGEVVGVGCEECQF